MPVPTLATKLYIPPLRPGIVPRPNLIKRLNDSLATGSKLTLISAPAGFGKTTLVSGWIASCERPAAWLSLDRGDNDPARFMSYLVKAIQTIQAGIGDGLSAALQSPQPLQIENILTTLLNEISDIPNHFLLILDDYHLIDSQLVDQSLVFIIEHQPPQMHLVITTREDPSLPLSRLRAQGQLTEVRALDLRFRHSEVAEFLNQIMNLNLSVEDLTALESRTEGWIAGLQLAAISLQGHKDVAGFIQSFTGSHHFVMDYLLEEVLNQQPESIQNFLLRTSILERMCGPLCDAVLLDPSIPGQETLEYLERNNLFIVSLDNERRWYRYHHLFADLLRKRLGQSLTPEEIAELHILASEWHENYDLILEAFRLATAANDVERAVHLMESGKMPLHRRGTATTILDWLDTLSDTARNARPVLWWKQAMLMLTIGQTIGVEKKLQAAEAALATVTLPGTEPEFKNLIGKIAVARALLAQTQYQAEISLVQARKALKYLNSDNLSDRSSATRVMGFAYYWQGDFDEASRTYTEALSLAQTARDIANTISASIGLGQVQENQKQFQLATRTYQHVLQLTADYSPPNTVAAYLGLAQIFYQRNDLDAAEQYAEQGLKLAQQYDQIFDRIIMSYLYLALIKLAQRDTSGAAQMVSQAEQTSRQKNYTIRQPNIAFLQTWVHLHQEKLDAAIRIVNNNDIPLMRARVLIHQNDPVAALEILGQLRQEAEAKRWVGRLLDVMTVQSVALYACGEKEKAVELLGKVLVRAEPEGFIRLFIDEGKIMVQVLSEALSLGIMPDYVSKLLAAFDMETQKSTDQPDYPPSSRLIEPLSERELEVLRLLHSELSGPEIAERLIVSLNTLRTHTKNIFNKLGVNNRRSAVRRAEELDLF
jgi:LuxR family maltose regulon positive regulatory protein